MNTEISKEVKTIIINQELHSFYNSKYQLSLRHKVHTALKNAEVLKGIENEMLQIEQAIDILNTELNEL